MKALDHYLPYRRLKNLRYRFRRHASAQLRRIPAAFIKDYTLPDFLIIGAMKSGTTALYDLLQQHPGICAADTKEVGFLDRPEFYRFGESWYGSYFPLPRKMRHLSAQLGYRALTGEASPAMIRHSYAIKAARHVPNARLIVILRNPVERAYSHYQHVSRSITPDALSFAQALAAEQDRIRHDLEMNQLDPERAGSNLTRLGYMERGKYIEHIEQWLRYFPRSQMKILSYDQFSRQPVTVADEIVRYLDLPAHEFNAPRTLNRGHSSAPMDADSRRFLTEFYRPYNRRLFEFLDDDWGWPS
ncbi:MAG: sulfotransferase domain-containing protein [Halioglobus sp.]